MPWIRAFLIWLLMLAVPAQGAAATTMAFCGSDHHAASPPSQGLLSEPARHAHFDAAPGAAHRHSHLAAPEEAHSSFVSHSAASADAGDAAQPKCSACAPCCAVGAILSSLPGVPTPVFAPTVFSPIVPSVDMLAADGPDRPPRTVLA